jgi:hypothetical protein
MNHYSYGCKFGVESGSKQIKFVQAIISDYVVQTWECSAADFGSIIKLQN